MAASLSQTPRAVSQRNARASTRKNKAPRWDDFLVVWEKQVAENIECQRQLVAAEDAHLAISRQQLEASREANALLARAVDALVAVAAASRFPAYPYPFPRGDRQ